MKTFFANVKNRRGFTLIEVIVTLVVASIMGAVLVQFLSAGLLRSANPVIGVKEFSSLRQVMDDMTADYKFLAATQSDFLENFKDRVYQGHYGSGFTYTTKYIGFDGTNKENTAPEGDKILKVTITRGNQHITALFTR